MMMTRAATMMSLTRRIRETVASLPGTHKRRGVASGTGAALGAVIGSVALGPAALWCSARAAGPSASPWASRQRRADRSSTCTLPRHLSVLGSGSRMPAKMLKHKDVADLDRATDPRKFQLRVRRAPTAHIA